MAVMELIYPLHHSILGQKHHCYRIGVQQVVLDKSCQLFKVNWIPHKRTISQGQDARTTCSRKSLNTRGHQG